MKHESSLTSKGQVTIPKDIRDALGLKPGQKVRFEIDDDGNARIVKRDAMAEKADFLRRLAEVRQKYRLQDEFAGMGGLEFQRWIRGDGPEV